MRKVARTTTLPWCTCKFRKGDGFIAWPTLDSPLWVHNACKKPTRLFWEGHAARAS